MEEDEKDETNKSERKELEEEMEEDQKDETNKNERIEKKIST